MEIIFREKKKYCKDADMYLFDTKNTDEYKLKKRKIIKISISIVLLLSLIMNFTNKGYSRILSYQDTSLVIISFMAKFTIVIILILGLVLGFFILDKIGFKIGENRGRNLLSKIGGRNFEKYVDADVKIVATGEELIWTRASKKLNLRYEDIKKIEDTGEYTYIFIDKKSVIWIPREANIPVGERENLVNFIKSKVEEINMKSSELSQGSV